jgi:hypothetical protein
MYYLRSRFYDPGAGRFLTPDTIEPEPQYPQTYSPYVYASANPTRFTDPTGTQDLGELGIALSIVGILSSIAMEHFPQPVVQVARALGLNPNEPLGVIEAANFLWEFTAATPVHGIGYSLEAAGGLWFSESFGTQQNAFEVGFYAGGELQLGLLPESEPESASLWAGLTFQKGDLKKMPEWTSGVEGFVWIGGTLANLLAKGLVPSFWTMYAGGLIYDHQFGQDWEKKLTFLLNGFPTQEGESLTPLAKLLAPYFGFDLGSPRRTRGGISIELGFYCPIYQQHVGLGLSGLTNVQGSQWLLFGNGN